MCDSELRDVQSHPLLLELCGFRISNSVRFSVRFSEITEFSVRFSVFSNTGGRSKVINTESRVSTAIYVLICEYILYIHIPRIGGNENIRFQCYIGLFMY